MTYLQDSTLRCWRHRDTSSSCAVQMFFNLQHTRMIGYHASDDRSVASCRCDAFFITLTSHVPGGRDRAGPGNSGLHPQLMWFLSQEYFIMGRKLAVGRGLLYWSGGREVGALQDQYALCFMFLLFGNLPLWMYLILVFFF